MRTFALVAAASVAAAAAMLLGGCASEASTTSEPSSPTTVVEAPDPSSGPGTSAPPQRPNATVVRVIDGDTIEVDAGDQRERVRLIGIDTPESVDPRRPVACFGKEASAHTDSVLPRGTPVVLVRDVEARDRYGRLLAYVYRASDGLFVNLALARDGYATTLTYPPNVAHAEELRAAVAEARAGGLGLWGACSDFGVPADR